MWKMPLHSYNKGRRNVEGYLYDLDQISFIFLKISAKGFDRITILTFCDLQHAPFFRIYKQGYIIMSATRRRFVHADGFYPRIISCFPIQIGVFLQQ